jgi:hypothetical protein
MEGGKRCGAASGSLGPAGLQKTKSKQMPAAGNVDRRKDLG